MERSGVNTHSSPVPAKVSFMSETLNRFNRAYISLGPKVEAPSKDAFRDYSLRRVVSEWSGFVGEEGRFDV